MDEFAVIGIVVGVVWFALIAAVALWAHGQEEPAH
jgi:hypothetical protein